jgi:ubiquinone/menaquinone biosynthesis C-methylase UbiE
MLASNIRALLRPMRIMLGVLAVFVLVQIVLRVFRRAAPEPMPWRLAPMLTTRWRSRLFGAPERVLDRAGAAAGMHVLEVGPGPGMYTVPLAQRVASSGEDGRVTCLEIQPQMIEMLRERLRAAEVRNVEVIQGDGRQMPLPDDGFDLVFLVDVVGEIPDKAAFFGECARVLKPDGILAVTEQISDPDFHLPSTVRTLAAAAGLREVGMMGLPWWTYTARYRK